MAPPDMPEHEKLQALDGENQTIGDFLTWLEDQGVFLMIHNTTAGWISWEPRSTEERVAKYFGIDYQAFAAEKDALLEYVREEAARADAVKRDQKIKEMMEDPT